jgi:hypothetical protein
MWQPPSIGMKAPQMNQAPGPLEKWPLRLLAWTDVHDDGVDKEETK